MSSTLAIRVDAGPKIGGGHLMRCLALAMEWKRQGGKVIFIAHCENESLLKRITESGMEVINVEEPHPDPEDLKKTIKELKRIKDATEDMNNNWIVLDGYHFDPDYQKTIKGSGWKILVIDDMAHHSYYHADVLLNQNFHAMRLHYSCHSETRIMLGPKYCLIRPEFLEWRHWNKPTSPIARKVLVTFGASDPYGLSIRFIRLADQIRVEGLEMKILAGPAASNESLLLEAMVERSSDLQILSGVSNMPSLMADVDTAITSGGTTIYELAFMRVPSLVVATSEPERYLVKGLSDLGLFRILPEIGIMTDQQIANQIRCVLNDYDGRRIMVEGSRRFVDGMGAQRVVGRLCRWTH